MTNKEKTILVTGASNGIGFQLEQFFAFCIRTTCTTETFPFQKSV